MKQYSQTNTSVIQWIEKVPKHWKVERIKYRVKINKKTLDDKTDPNLEILYIDVGSVHTGGKIDEPEKMSFKESTLLETSEKEVKIIRSGQINKKIIRKVIRSHGYSHKIK